MPRPLETAPPPHTALALDGDGAHPSARTPVQRREGSGDDVLDLTAYEARSMADVRAVTDRLLTELAGQLAPGIVLVEVTRSRAHLLHAGVRAGLATATESMARARLVRRLPTPLPRTPTAHGPEQQPSAPADGTA